MTLNSPVSKNNPYDMVLLGCTCDNGFDLNEHSLPFPYQLENTCSFIAVIKVLYTKKLIL